MLLEEREVQQRQAMRGKPHFARLAHADQRQHVQPIFRTVLPYKLGQGNNHCRPTWRPGHVRTRPIWMVRAQIAIINESWVDVNASTRDAPAFVHCGLLPGGCTGIRLASSTVCAEITRGSAIAFTFYAPACSLSKWYTRRTVST